MLYMQYVAILQLLIVAILTTAQKDAMLEMFCQPQK